MMKDPLRHAQPHALGLVLAAAVLASPLAAQEAPAESVPELEIEEEVDLRAEGEVASESKSFEFLTEEEEELAALQTEMEDVFSLFAMIYETEPLTEEQEAALPLAEAMAAAIMPDGSMGKAVELSVEPMLDLMMVEIVGSPTTRLGDLTGLSVDDLSELDEETAQSALDVFDPNYTARSEQVGEVMLEFTSELLVALEPAYRNSLSRALVTRFEASEMTELLTFFETPLGAKFAAESFLVQHDPAIMGVMEQMGPAMIEILPKYTERFDSIDVDIANARGFDELSAAERKRIASLLGKSQAELDALVPQIDVEVLEGEDGEPII